MRGKVLDLREGQATYMYHFIPVFRSFVPIFLLDFPLKVRVLSELNK